VAAMKAASEGINYEPFAPSQGLSVRTVHVVSSPDGNTINLQFIVPPGSGPWPCVYYIHGGGMMMSSCFDPNYRAWGRMIASHGVVVVMVDFRNALRASSVPQIMPFPAGLNDCLSGLRWLHANHDSLDIDPTRIAVAGESGGANLAVATALKLKQDGDIGFIKGLYLLCPYLSGEWPSRVNGSAVENAGILMDIRSNYGAMAYGIAELRGRNPLAWPAFATEQDVTGFPPVIISVNECDPLRDDGIDFYRLLVRAGVRARCRQIVGTVHATEVYVICCPDISRDAALHIADFCSN
jgi:acetyl esterase